MDCITNQAIQAAKTHLKLLSDLQKQANYLSTVKITLFEKSEVGIKC